MRIAGLCAVLCLYVFPVHAVPVFGDINCDEITNVVDVQLSILMALGLPMGEAVDADQDGVYDLCQVEGWACGPGTISDGDTGLCVPTGAVCGVDTVWEPITSQCVVAPGALTEALEEGFSDGYAAAQAEILPVTCGPDTVYDPETMECVVVLGPGTAPYEAGYGEGYDAGYGDGYDAGVASVPLVTCGPGTELAPDGMVCVPNISPGTPCYEAGYEAGTLASATCSNGGVLVPQGDGFVCDCPFGFGGATCDQMDNGTSFNVLESQDITYEELDYVLLKVELISDLSVADNWCYEYQNLCDAYDAVPTGCGSNFNGGSYGDCKETYNSVGVSNSLGCNASSGVANAAQQAGYGDASSQNSFAFHSCGGSCLKEMCPSGSCNTALSYVSMAVDHAYTLCKKIPGGCGIGTDVDINNCGACGNVCTQVANASVTCTVGECVIESCNFGYADCDGAYDNGCEIDTMNNPLHCGVCDSSCGAEACTTGTCASSTNSFNVLESQDITYDELDYVLLKVELSSNMSVADNWCYEYQNLCDAYDAVPTGCGSNFNGGSYGDCKSTYNSVGVSNSLGCNASGGVANAAQQAGYGDASSQNSFAFHSCGGSCLKEMCPSGSCNTALSYVSMGVDHAYTLCKKIPGGCGIGTDVDINNCGACGNICTQVANASVTCTVGECVIESCNFGYADCDGVYDNGCEIDTMNNPLHCGVCDSSCGGESCTTGTCASSTSSFSVLESQVITYQDISYTLLKVALNSNMSVADNWCYEYQNLCSDFGGVPTGCGSNFNGGGYGDCKSIYGSDGVSNSLGCNASGGVANAAQESGYGDASSQNSFAFHSCGGSCQKEMCPSGSCNTALSYVSMAVDHAYTLCKMP